ncbi:hypothetical protein ACIBTV_27515 [Micromonospora sp. NPDC049366]|uniref:hypothetical protein n=1 Tax=Micromonospora sp. NPDC049366 TaxID=3364271 RepID=UPI0037AB5C7A
MTTEPTLRLLSLGAGVQSTVLALMAADGTLPGLDGAIFADTGWEPRKVYEHLARLEKVLEAAGIPLYRVRSGNLRHDSLDPAHRYASVPYFVLGPTGSCDRCAGTGQITLPAIPEDPHELLPGEEPMWSSPSAPTKPDVAVCPTCIGTTRSLGMGRRQCTSEYKLAPIGRKVRELLGAAAPDFRYVPKGQIAEQWIGFSTDEIGRVSDKDGVSYIRKRYPLLDLGMSRKDCQRWLTARGWGDTAKSACIGCPFHGNAQWRDLRDNHPDEWADAVAFDEAIRKGGARGLPLDGEAFLHRSRLPLAVAPIDRVTRKEWADRSPDIFDALAEAELAESGDPDGCSPYGCRSGAPA